MADHLYTHGGKRRNLPKFERRYGSRKGKKVYGAVVGKVRRERMAKGLCSVQGCGAPASHRHGMHGCCGRPDHHSQVSYAHMMGGEAMASSWMAKGGFKALDGISPGRVSLGASLGRMGKRKAPGF